MKPDLFSFPDVASLTTAVARQWLDLVAEAARLKAPHRVALAGGRVAGSFMAAAAREAQSRGLKCAGVDFFWGDERCVPPDHPDSNYRLAAAALLKPLGIGPERIHRICGELEPAAAAQAAEAELRAAGPVRPTEQPVLDLVLLGMGEDGHVASLFPDAPPAVLQSQATYLSVTGPKPPPQRVTLSYPAIFAARRVWVLVQGQGKEPALQASLADGCRTPLGRVVAGRAITVFVTL